MRIRRHFTAEGHSPYEGIPFRTAVSEIRNPDGSIVFAQDGIEVPEGWSQVACDVLAQKYFRKAGVPKQSKPIAEEGLPSFLWRRQGVVGIRARCDKLHEAHAGCLRQAGRIEDLRGRIAKYRGIEMRIARPACIRSDLDLVGDALNAEPPEPPAVIGIDSNHQRQNQ